MNEEEPKTVTYVVINACHWNNKYWNRGDEYVQGPGTAKPPKHFCVKRPTYVKEVKVEAAMVKSLDDMNGPQIAAFIKKHYDKTLPPGQMVDRLKAQAIQIIQDPSQHRMPDSVVEGAESPMAEQEDAKQPVAGEEGDKPLKAFKDMTPDDHNELTKEIVVSTVKERFGVTLEDDMSKDDMILEAMSLEEKLLEAKISDL